MVYVVLEMSGKKSVIFPSYLTSLESRSLTHNKLMYENYTSDLGVEVCKDTLIPMFQNCI